MALKRGVALNSWANWARSQSCSPLEIIRPTGRAELAEKVAAAASAGRQITAPGSGHSFTAAALTDDLMLDTSGLSGVIEADLTSGLVKVGAGTVLADLNRDLDQLGLAMVNLGDIDKQTIAGAISTGTHGTGAAMPNLPAQVAAIDLVTADGEVHELNEDETLDLLRAARVSIGSLGVIAAVTLRAVPAFNLHRVDDSMPLDRVLADFDELAAENQHFEFFVSPYTDTALTICRNHTDRPLARRGRFERLVGDVVIENWLGDLALRAIGSAPSMIPRVARFYSYFMNQTDQVDVSHRVFANYRTIRFNEMEYALPREAGLNALSDVLELIRAESMPLTMPIECRVVAADDNLISPVAGRDSTYIAVHQHASLEWRPYLRAIEQVFDSYGGRPHWGKHHFQTAETLAGRYPEWDRFGEIRDQLDPNRTFTNDYVRAVLGE